MELSKGFRNKMRDFGVTSLFIIVTRVIDHKWMDNES